MAEKAQQLIIPACEKEDPVPVAHAAEQNVLVSVLSRVMLDTSMPMERVSQAMDAYERSEKFREEQRRAEAERAYYAALPAMQADMPVIKREGKSHQSKYARWEDIMPKIQPVMARHGFAISFKPEIIEGNKLRVHARLSHKDGHFEDAAPFVLPADTSGQKNPIQALGSTTSYAKRYIALAMLNVVSADDVDDDATSAVGGFITEAQIEELKALIVATEADIEKIMAWAKVKKFSDIPASKFNELKSLLKTKRGK